MAPDSTFCQMPRPPEYENLIKTKAFEAVQATQGAVAGYLKNSGDYLGAAKELAPAKIAAAG
jgi:hypothetical protein